jgi:hypothetical protein
MGSYVIFHGSNAMRKNPGRGEPGGMGAGMSGSTVGKRLARKVATSKGGGNRKGGIASSQVKSAHNRRKMNNQKVISAMRKS